MSSRLKTFKKSAKIYFWKTLAILLLMTTSRQFIEYQRGRVTNDLFWWDWRIRFRWRFNSAKSCFMKHRVAMKKKSNNMIRLSDDVTKLHSELIYKLSKKDRINSAWYFNGKVYGQVFDIVDEFNSKIGDEMYRRQSGD